MPWIDLMDLADATNLFSLSRPTFHEDRAGLDNFYHAFWNPVNRYRPSENDPGVSLAEWVNRTRHFLASDPRDKIFALLHVAFDSREVIHTDARLAPDYNKSLVEVVLDYSDAGFELPFGIRTNEEGEDVTTDFEFGLWLDHDLFHLYEKSIPLEGTAESPLFPYQGRRVAVIEDPDYDLWEDTEKSRSAQHIFITTDGRYSARNKDIMRGDEIVTCVGSEQTFVISLITIDGLRRYACRGPCKLIDIDVPVNEKQPQ